MTTFKTLKIETAGEFVTRVVMNRPECANALNTAMARELVIFFEALASDPRNTRCVILTGTGEKAFCAGGDLNERRTMNDEVWQLQHFVFERMARALADCPVPVIGAVNGAAYGGGCEIAALCDFIHAASTAWFALVEVTLGIIPGAGGTQTLARAVGERRAKELILTGQRFSAADAYSWGLVNSVCDPTSLQSTALASAELIACNAPLSVRQAKQSIHRGLQMSLRDGMAFEVECYNRLVPTEDRREGILAFHEKRHPVFRGK